MALDPTTESIAHFIGLFRLAPDSGRFHQDYERILSDPEEDAERGPLDLGIAAIRVPHDPEGFDPKLSYSGPDHAYTYQSILLEQPTGEGLGKALTFQIGLSLPSFEGPALGAPSASASAGRVDIEIPPPGSLIAVTVQQAYLSDDDVFGAVEGQGFEPVAPLTEALRQLAAVAEELHTVTVDVAHGSADWSVMAREALDTLPEAGRTQEGTLTVATLRGEGAYGIHVNGVALEEMPLWTDYLPVHLDAESVPLPRPPEEVDEAEGPEEGASGDAPHDFARDFDGHEAPAFPQGHQVVTGGNMAVNHVSLVSNWLDAPVIAVAGDVFKLDAISQVNLLVEHDWAPGIGGPASTAVNAAELTLTPTGAEEGGAAAGGQGAAGMPPMWSVVRIEGDVTQINWVDQFTFATDHDRATVTVSGSDTKIGLGENLIVNEAFFWELGWAYDLIIVGGNLIDLSVIKQTNVLLDSDTVLGGEAVAGAGDPPVAAGPAAETGGGATPGEAVAGRDGPAKLIEAGEKAEGPAAPADPTPAKPAESSAGDNLLWNEARIETIGEDVHARLDDAFAETIRKLADGATEIEPDVAMDPLFDGLDLLKVLYISGDFVTVDKITQTNVLGDADQVNLAREAFEKDLGEQIAVTTGSNLAANIAEIVDAGMDSEVMAGGDVYSDALIHQAELIDDEPVQHGEIAALATEAVAFLADDMISGLPSATEISARTDAAIAETAGQSDVMQTVLA